MRTITITTLAAIFAAVFFASPVTNPAPPTPLPASAFAAVRAPVTDPHLAVVRAPERGRPMASAARAVTTSMTVRPGDSLSAISKRIWGTSKAWPALWWVNRHKVKDPGVILSGWRLRVPRTHKVPHWLARRALSAVAPTPVATYAAGSNGGGGTVAPPPPSGGSCGPGGTLSYGQLEALWVCGGGPSWAEASAATIAECESGGQQYAHNPSGASGYWQILGQVVAGNIYDPEVNAENAVSKFHASGDTFAQWVCQASAVMRGTSVVRARLLSTTTTLRPRLKAFYWARTQRGCWYVWGGSGPCRNGYDCSGLVMAAWWRAHVSLPHNTGWMVASGKLIRIPASRARKGDIVMFFSYGSAVHAGLVAYKWRWMLDAPEPGKKVGVHRIVDWGSGISHAFYRVRRLDGFQ